MQKMDVLRRLVVALVSVEASCRLVILADMSYSIFMWLLVVCRSVWFCFSVEFSRGCN